MTDHTLEAGVYVDLNGNLQRNAVRFEDALNRFSRNGSRHMTKLQRTTAAVDRTMSRLGNRWVALATGGSVVAAGRMVVGLEERLERLGIQANISSKEIRDLKKDIFDAASAPDIRVDAGELISAVEEIVEKTGDLDFAINNLENLGLVISATAAEGRAIGGIAAEFQKMGLIETDQVRQALDILITQGKEGAFTLQNLAALGPRVVTAYTSMGRGGIPAIRELGSALQVIRMATGSSEQAATSFEAFLRVLSDADKVKVLQKGGIQVFDPEQLKEGREVLRPINELMVEIIKAAQGKKTILSDVLGDSEALRAFSQAVTEFNLNGDVGSLEKFMNLQADGTNLSKDSARAAGTAAASMRLLRNSMEAFADKELSGPIANFADEIDRLTSSDVIEFFDGVKDTALAVGGILLGYQAMKFGKGAFDSVARARKGPLEEGVSNVAPIPVFVVNQVGSLGGTAGSAKPNGKSPGKLGKLATAGALTAAGGSAAISLAGAGLVGYQVGTLANDHLIAGTAFGDAIGEAVAHLLAGFGNQEARRALIANGDLESSVSRDRRGRITRSDEKVRVELDMTAEASRMLAPKSVTGDAANVAVSGTLETF